jgi:hypothetical protein
LILLKFALAQTSGEEARTWESIYDGRLVAALEGSPQLGVQYYEQILEGLSADSPARGQVLYWLGHARFLSGDLARAAAVLKEAQAWPDVKDASTRLLARIELERQSALVLPLNWDFSGGVVGFVLGSLPRSHESSLKTEILDNNPVLSWTRFVSANEIDSISMGLVDTPARSIAFRAMARNFPVDLQVVVLGTEGGRYGAPLTVIPEAEWVYIRISLSSLRSLDAASRGPLKNIRNVELQDLSGYLSSDRGENILYLDDFSIY